MLNLDNIAQDYDKMCEIIAHNKQATFEDWFDFFKGFNEINDEDFKQFDFNDGDYTYTIVQRKDLRPVLDNNFIVWIGADGIEFERS